MEWNQEQKQMMIFILTESVVVSLMKGKQWMEGTRGVNKSIDTGGLTNNKSPFESSFQNLLFPNFSIWHPFYSSLFHFISLLSSFLSVNSSLVFVWITLSLSRPFAQKLNLFCWVSLSLSYLPFISRERFDSICVCVDHITSYPINKGTDDRTFGWAEHREGKRERESMRRIVNRTEVWIAPFALLKNFFKRVWICLMTYAHILGLSLSLSLSEGGWNKREKSV